MTKSRLEAFSDGVFAIIITIMVLELRRPHEPTWEALSSLLPVLTGYTLSFVFLGIYWVNHHHLLHTLPGVNSGVMWSNFLLLFFLSLVPFTTGWMGDTHFGPVPVFLYAANLLLCAVSYYLLQQVIMRSWRHETALREALRKQERKGMLSLLLYLVALGAAFYSPLVSAVCFVAVSIIWIVPDRNIEKALSERETEQQ